VPVTEIAALKELSPAARILLILCHGEKLKNCPQPKKIAQKLVCELPEIEPVIGFL